MQVQLAPVPGTSGNLFLDALPRDSAERLLAHMVLVDVGSGAPIARAREPIECVVFPLSCVVSSVARMRDGSDVEVALTGREGFFGIPFVLGGNVSATEAMVQIPNQLYRMPSVDFESCLRDDRALYDRCLSYVQVMMDTIGQFAACNRLHPINERCARWLLMAHDRVPGHEIFLTHEFLATMLGVRRPGVSIAAAALESAGLIEYHRGRIIVTNRPGLEQASCECYAFANDTLKRLLGYDIRKR
jgi:CRP-like cAMP-binding protein